MRKHEIYLKSNNQIIVHPHSYERITSYIKFKLTSRILFQFIGIFMSYNYLLTALFISPILSGISIIHRRKLL